jgi:hypothetical protein
MGSSASCSVVTTNAAMALILAHRRAEEGANERVKGAAQTTVPAKNARRLRS